MNKNEQKSLKTKKKLQAAFIDLYSQKNIEKITIKELTDKAGLNRGTFYIHYLDIYDLFNNIKINLLHEIEKKADKIFEKKQLSVKVMVENILDLYHQVGEKLIPIITKDATFTENIKTILKSKIFPNYENQEINYLLEYHFSAVISTINLWVKNNKNVSPTELIKLIVEISSKGILTLVNERYNNSTMLVQKN